MGSLGIGPKGAAIKAYYYLGPTHSYNNNSGALGYNTLPLIYIIGKMLYLLWGRDNKLLHISGHTTRQNNYKGPPSHLVWALFVHFGVLGPLLGRFVGLGIGVGGLVGGKWV
jgi:hypothetical protein